jgi:spermidine synthase
MDEKTLKERVVAGDYSALPTRFLNGDAVISMVHFGRGVIDPSVVAEVAVNRRSRPVLHRYYAAGSWGIY